MPVKDIYIDGLTRGKTLQRTFLFYSTTMLAELVESVEQVETPKVDMMVFAELIPQKL